MGVCLREAAPLQRLAAAKEGIDERKPRQDPGNKYVQYRLQQTLAQTGNLGVR